MAAQVTETAQERDWAWTALAWLAGLAAAGSAIMALAHMGLQIPVISGLGPGGARSVPVAALVFGISTLMFLLILFGMLMRRAWAWPVALVGNGFALIGAANPFRGPVSAAAIAVTVAAIAILLSPPGRTLR
ncbi:MAG TPA: hypothetical protein VML96_07840 [Egibacteraceae bacterium]|nr:hypothetical protein [Egibacteraceae bacterium]